MAMPSASYAITMRLHLDLDDHRALGPGDDGGRRAGGAVTAVDFVDTAREQRTVDVTVNARDGDHAEELTAAVDALDGVKVHRVSDRTFLLHLRRQAGGQPDGAAEDPRRHVDGLHARRGARLPGAGRQARRRLAPDDQGQHRRDRHRRLGRARPRQHRPDRRAAGDGGQGRAVQGVRRRRRLAGLPRHPGHRRDRRDRRGDGAGLRRHQPRGHRRPALLRDRGAAARVAGHPGLPRRPARHGDRRAGGADQRAAAGRQAD